MKDQRIDPELLQQLDGADAEGIVQALLTVIDPESLPLPSADEVNAIAERVLSETIAHTHLKPERYRVFPHLGTLAVEAKAEFVRDMIRQDAVLGAAASHRPGVFRRGS